MKSALPSQNPVCRYCPGCQHRVKGANFGGLKGTTLYRIIGGAVKNSVAVSISSVGGRGDIPRIAKEAPDFRQKSA